MVAKNLSGIQSATTKVYSIALFLVAALSTLAYFTMHEVIVEHKSRAGVINLSGRQRMLSQRIVLYIEEVDHAKATGSANADTLATQLSGLIDNFENAHRDLSLGSPALGTPNSEVKEIYFGAAQHLDRDVKEFISMARVLLADSNGQHAEGKLEPIRIAALEVILPKLDLVVKMNQEESEKQVTKLHTAESLILCLTLALLVIEALFIFRPMTLRIGRLLEEALDAREAAVKATDEKSAFLATITHEIRTPLTGVFGIIENLLGSTLPQKQEEQVQMLGRLTNSLLALVNDILDYSKIEAGKLSIENVDFNLSALVKDTQTLFQSSAQAKNIQLFVEMDPILPVLLNGDPTRMRQVVTNFIGNALKFTPQGGSIRVSFRRNGVSESDIPFRVEVQDSGCGIPKTAQSGIFGSYNQGAESTARKFGGTGLGLAISKQIIETMGGKIGFQSVENQGSTFWFEVSLSAAKKLEEVVSQTKQAAPALELVGTGHNLLLAEDDEINQKIMANQLRKLGFNVTPVSNGQEALTAIAATSFDIVVLDCEMPVMDGYTAVTSIRQLEKTSGTAHVSVVAMTGHSSEEIKQKCLHAGMDAFITKPIRVEALGKALKPYLPIVTTSSKAA